MGEFKNHFHRRGNFRDMTSTQVHLGTFLLGKLHIKIISATNVITGGYNSTRLIDFYAIPCRYDIIKEIN